MNPSCVLGLLVLASLLTLPVRAEVYRIDISGSVDFLGCPSPISCPAFPLLWGISGGETLTATFLYDDAAPLALLEDQTPTLILARYDHPLPLSAPIADDV